MQHSISEGMTEEKIKKLIFYLKFTRASVSDIVRITGISNPSMRSFNFIAEIRTSEQLARSDKESLLRKAKRKRTPKFYFSEQEKLQVLEVNKQLLLLVLARILERSVQYEGRDEELYELVKEYVLSNLDYYD